MQTLKNAVITSLATATLLLFVAVATRAQAPQPDVGGIRPGVLPRMWLLGGPKCVEIPEFQVHEYNEDLYILGRINIFCSDRKCQRGHATCPRYLLSG